MVLMQHCSVVYVRKERLLAVWQAAPVLAVVLVLTVGSASEWRR